MTHRQLGSRGRGYERLDLDADDSIVVAGDADGQLMPGSGQKGSRWGFSAQRWA